MTPRQAMSKAVMRIMRTSPFYTTIIMKHKFVEDPEVNGMIIDGKSIKYNADDIMKLETKELAEFLKHMAMHIAHHHHVRSQSIRPRYEKKCKEAGTTFDAVFNEAADLSINSILRDTDRRLWSESKAFTDAPIPGEGKFVEIDDGDNAETYTGQVLKIYEQEPKEEKEDDGDGGSDGEKDQNQQCSSSGSGDGNSDSDDDSDDQSDGQPEGERKVNFGQVKAAQGETHEAENDADAMVASAIMAAKQAGEDTFAVKSFIEENEKPVKVNWRNELNQFLSIASKGRPNYKHINRRIFGDDIIMPTTKDKSPRKIVLLVDVSGSMSDQAVSAVYSHIETIIMEKKTVEIELVPFDAEVFTEDIQSFNCNNMPIKDSDRKRVAYGGTRFMPAVKYAESSPNLSGIIMLTDMLPCDRWEFEEHKTQYPWVILSVLEFQFGHHNITNYAQPKWARVLEIEP